MPLPAPALESAGAAAFGGTALSLFYTTFLYLALLTGEKQADTSIVIK